MGLANCVEQETFIPLMLVEREMKKEVITSMDTTLAFREEAEAEMQRKRADKHPPVLQSPGLAYYWQSLN